LCPLSKEHLKELEVFHRHIKSIREKGQVYQNYFDTTPDSKRHGKFVLIVPHIGYMGYPLTTRRRFELLEHIVEAGYLKILSLPRVFMGEVYHKSLSPDVYLIKNYDNLISYIMTLNILLPITDIEL
jgi:hypothetical protein